MSFEFQSTAKSFIIPDQLLEIEWGTANGTLDVRIESTQGLFSVDFQATIYNSVGCSCELFSGTMTKTMIIAHAVLSVIGLIICFWGELLVVCMCV